MAAAEAPYHQVTSITAGPATRPRQDSNLWPTAQEGTASVGGFALLSDIASVCGNGQILAVAAEPRLPQALGVA
jgi:hypothetical protein